MDDADRRVLALSKDLAARAAEPGRVAAEVELLCRAGGVRAPEARAAAAEILLGSADRSAVALAHDLALALTGKVADALSLAARSFDRLRVLDGLPQKFGTQRAPDGGEWPCDPATTDSERKKWGLPPLAELRVARGT